MTEAELLEQIKYRLGITGDYHDNLLTGLSKDVKEYLLDAGVSNYVIESDVSVGIIARGVSDLWNYGAGDGKFSEVFYQRAIQLRYKSVGENPSRFGVYSKDEIDEKLKKVATDIIVKDDTRNNPIIYAVNGDNEIIGTIENIPVDEPIDTETINNIIGNL